MLKRADNGDDYDRPVSTGDTERLTEFMDKVSKVIKPAEFIAATKAQKEGISVQQVMDQMHTEAKEQETQLPEQYGWDDVQGYVNDLVSSGWRPENIIDAVEAEFPQTVTAKASGWPVQSAEAFKVGDKIALYESPDKIGVIKDGPKTLRDIASIDPEIAKLPAALIEREKDRTHYLIGWDNGPEEWVWDLQLSEYSESGPVKTLPFTPENVAPENWFMSQNSNGEKQEDRMAKEGSGWPMSAAEVPVAVDITANVTVKASEANNETLAETIKQILERNGVTVNQIQAKMS